MPLLMIFSTLLLTATSATQSSYPSFADYAGAAYNVSYDNRALTLNGQHVLFVSGAVHPPRGTQGDWASWFASAKQNGLNTVTVCCKSTSSGTSFIYFAGIRYSI